MAPKQKLGKAKKASEAASQTADLATSTRADRDAAAGTCLDRDEVDARWGGASGSICQCVRVVWIEICGNLGGLNDIACATF